MRKTRLELVLDTSAFTPEQMQPRYLLWLAMYGWAAWLKEHATSFRKLLLEHNTGVVVLGGELEFHEPFRFFDADTVVAECGVRVLKNGGIVQTDVTVLTHDGKKAATLRSSCRPVLIADASLGASSGGLPASVKALFQPDEISSDSPPRPVPRMVEEVTSKGKLVVSAEHPLFIHRHQVEVADQWSYIESSAFAETGRELTCRANRKEHPILNKGLGVALKVYALELSRPMYTYDAGSIATSVYQMAENELACVHTINSPTAGGRPHALIVERLRPV